MIRCISDNFILMIQMNQVKNNLKIKKHDGMFFEEGKLMCANAFLK